MNGVDLAIIFIVFFSLIIGLFRGFVREVLSLASWIVALWAAYRYAQAGAFFLATYIEQAPLRVGAAFAIIFVAVLLAASFLGNLLCRLLALGGVGGVDRSLGLLFGVGRGALIVGALILIAIFTDVATQPWWQRSLLVDHFTPVVDLLRSLMPPSQATHFQPSGGLG